MVFCLYAPSGTEFDTVRNGFNAMAFKFGRPGFLASDRARGAQL